MNITANRHGLITETKNYRAGQWVTFQVKPGIWLAGRDLGFYTDGMVEVHHIIETPDGVQHDVRPGMSRFDDHAKAFDYAAKMTAKYGHLYGRDLYSAGSDRTYCAEHVADVEHLYPTRRLGRVAATKIARAWVGSGQAACDRCAGRA